MNCVYGLSELYEGKRGRCCGFWYGAFKSICAAICPLFIGIFFSRGDSTLHEVAYCRILNFEERKSKSNKSKKKIILKFQKFNKQN
jgi:hypothetical protein